MEILKVVWSYVHSHLPKGIVGWLVAIVLTLVCVAMSLLLIGREIVYGNGNTIGIRAPKPVTSLSSSDSVTPLGTVIASVLSPAKFKELYGDSWILADGSNIIGTPLSSAIQKESIPDLRGVFIRGINLDRDKNTGDPEGQNRQAGNYQRDSVGDHRHHYSDIYFSEAGGTIAVPHALGSNKTDKDNRGFEMARDTSGVEGATESRPRNVAVYYYIRVR